jgi:hypothetical protein
MVRLSKEQILELFCYCCQAMRSVHRAHATESWSDFQHYYAGDRIEGVRGLIDGLGKLAPSSRNGGVRLSRQEVGLAVPVPGVFRYLFGRWFTRWQRAWLFAEREIRFITATLQSLLELLALPDKPPAEVLIALRQDLGSCSGIIDMRCYGLEELDRARYIEHFDRTEWVRHYKLEEILPETAAPARAGKA